MVYAIVAVTMLVFALVDLLIRVVRARWPYSKRPAARGTSKPVAVPTAPASGWPEVHIVTASSADLGSNGAIHVPAGLFVAPGHTWVALLTDGRVRVGLDDLAVKVLGPFDGFDLPEPGAELDRGEPLLSVFRGGRTTHVLAPVSGRVTDVNPALARIAGDRPGDDWICCFEPRDLSGDLGSLVLGARARDHYEAEISRCLELCGGHPDRVASDAETWNRVADALLRPEQA